MDRRGDELQLLGVLTCVVGAEEEFSTAGELDSHVGLGTTAITTVKRCELRTGCDSCGHVGLLPFSWGDVYWKEQSIRVVHSFRCCHHLLRLLDGECI
jgi:hypothetical protein